MGSRTFIFLVLHLLHPALDFLCDRLGGIVWGWPILVGLVARSRMRMPMEHSRGLHVRKWRDRRGGDHGKTQILDELEKD